jgi:hypothetical protein
VVDNEPDRLALAAKYGAIPVNSASAPRRMTAAGASSKPAEVDAYLAQRSRRNRQPAEQICFSARRGPSEPALAGQPVRKVIQALEPAGYSYARTKGSHAVYPDLKLLG